MKKGIGKKNPGVWLCPMDGRKKSMLARKLFVDSSMSIYSVASGRITDDRFVVDDHSVNLDKHHAGTFINVAAALSWISRFPGMFYRIAQVDMAAQQVIAAVVVKVKD